MTLESEQTKSHSRQGFTSIEICAGAGGQAIGLHQAGFDHLALVEIDPFAVETLELNIRQHDVWTGSKSEILQIDVKTFDPFHDLVRTDRRLAPGELDLLAGGVPCPPFSQAGKQLGKDDERDLFPRMLELIEILRPRAVMIENVRGIMDPKFSTYRDWITVKLEGGMLFGDDGQIVQDKGLGYQVCAWNVLEASDFGVPQLRPRAILVAFREDVIQGFDYVLPTATHAQPISVAEALESSMYKRFSPYLAGAHAPTARSAFDRWLKVCHQRSTEPDGGIAPTLVGGSKKHGGADLGPSRAKAAWRRFGVDPMGIANDPEIPATKRTEDRDLFRPDGPMLTVRQAAILQGFPSDWEFAGGKTAQYRQVGNAFPPPVAKAVGISIRDVLQAARERDC
ncbi:DNA cytosine methyltransferase [Nocardia sp. NPDC058058]|uniref:DNA cytosine methyltransferase n=1 Tax=Nocardia sp. NPDC058058 TaxID=3346317 RepID=UPI0036DB9866